ncbi:MAG: MMPL family transporter [Bifidobacteriaceae bacterium]|jgi:RND superfamily putative drug exporter|nr:MMPL family transporter [Bifidobacteriaceae bacterium]
MFSRLARGVVRHPLVTVIVWVVLTASGAALAVLGVTGEGLFDRVISGAPRASDSDSAQADRIVEQGESSAQSLTIAVSDVDLDDLAQLGRVGAALAPARQDLGQIDGVAKRPEDGYPMVIDPLNPTLRSDHEIDPASAEASASALQNPAVAALVAGDRRGFLMTVDISKDLSQTQEDTAAEAVVNRLEALAQELRDEGFQAEVGGESMILEDIVSAMKRDLEVSEMIALPVALVVMVLVFAGFLAAAMPVVGAMASIATCMGILFGLSYPIDLHTSVINVVSLIGVGLSIDYGLLIVSRFREELRAAAGGGAAGDKAAAKRLVRRAVSATVPTAGRTVFYSALTIAVCVAGLMAFDPPMLRTFGLAGLIVVLLSLAAATTLVPALLVLAGHRLARPSLVQRLPAFALIQRKWSDVSPEHGMFSKLAASVQKRPWLVIAGVLAALAFLAWPARGIELRNSTVELLPLDSQQRQFLAALDENYPSSLSDGIEVVSLGDIEATERFAKNKLSRIDGASLVKNPDGSYAQQMSGYVRVLLAVTEEDPEGPQARAAVSTVRAAARGDFAVHVTGPAARLLDFEDQLAKGAPAAAAIICLAVLVLLFMFTGSVLIPIKALITNGLSLLACLGVVTWVFQYGHFESLLGFNAMAGIESYILVLLLIFGFGLAMDYEVFLISRIKEAWDQSGDPQASVRDGLQHSGRIITSAALIIVMVFLGFSVGDLVIIKEIGIGLAVAVTIDATLVRMLLVPATMSILGKWNWWAPRPLAWAHRKLGLDH